MLSQSLSLCWSHHVEPTWLDIQWVFIDGQVHSLVSGVTEVLQDQIDSGGDALLHRLSKFHPAVDHDAPIPEVQDLQVLKVTQVGLQVGHKLGEDWDNVQVDVTNQKLWHNSVNTDNHKSSKQGKFTSSRKRCSKALYSGELLLKRSSEKIMLVTLRLKNTISARPGFTGMAMLTWSVPCATPNGKPVLPSSVWLIKPKPMLITSVPRSPVLESSKPSLVVWIWKIKKWIDFEMRQFASNGGTTIFVFL